MSLHVEREAAEAMLRRAWAFASSTADVPQNWEGAATRVFRMQSKTYTPAFGTALLAKATDVRVDALSIKSTHAQYTYSQRGIGHEVLVPLAQELGFSIRTTTREPLNNQPFSRYNHMAEMERVRHHDEHEWFILQVQALNHLSEEDAYEALAAFVRVGIKAYDERESFDVTTGLLTTAELLASIATFMEGPHDIPRRAQALAAASFDLLYADVRSRALNDPSRDLPGDVQVYHDAGPILSVEVRAKPVRASDVTSFADACHEAGIHKAFVVTTSERFLVLDYAVWSALVLERAGVVLTVVGSIERLVRAVLSWAELELGDGVDKFLIAALQRLKEIEALDESMQYWSDLSAKRTPKPPQPRPPVGLQSPLF